MLKSILIILQSWYFVQNVQEFSTVNKKTTINRLYISQRSNFFDPFCVLDQLGMHNVMGTELIMWYQACIQTVSRTSCSLNNKDILFKLESIRNFCM